MRSILLKNNGDVLGGSYGAKSFAHNYVLSGGGSYGA